MKYDLAIIGGGAAGLAAAIFAAQPPTAAQRIIILDGAKTLGAKILVSGGGRCNVTHDVITTDDFNGSRPVVRNILAAFGVPAAIAWFASLGVDLKREGTGKLFPTANTARSVLQALLHRCTELGIQIECDARVTNITPAPDAFTITHTGGTVQTARVIMATGGKSLPRTGSDGLGWEIVQRLGHRVTPTCAALVPLVLSESMFHAEVAGIAQEVQLSTFADNKLIDRRIGSMLWTHFGISGPVAMDASRHWVMAHEAGQQVRMECHLLPSESAPALEKWLISLTTSRISLAKALSTRLPARVARALIAHTQIDPALPCGQLPRTDRQRLITALTAMNLPITAHRGWNYAEVTAGGVPLDEIDYRTMESRKTPGLYLIGEMLDCDGRIGGFNFQWAWATGHLAGRAVAKKSALA